MRGSSECLGRDVVPGEAERGSSLVFSHKIGKFEGFLQEGEMRGIREKGALIFRSQ